MTGTWLAADQVRCFLLTDPDGGDLPAWAPGAHVDLFLPGMILGETALSFLAEGFADPSAYHFMQEPSREDAYPEFPGLQASAKAGSSPPANMTIGSTESCASIG